VEISCKEENSGSHLYASTCDVTKYGALYNRGRLCNANIMSIKELLCQPSPYNDTKVQKTHTRHI
jgi:hypothetical protein